MDTLSFTFIQERVCPSISFVPSDSVNTGSYQQDAKSGLLQLTIGSMVSMALSDNQGMPPSVPPDLSPEQIESFRAKGLTYRFSPEGYYICVWRDTETQEIAEFIYNAGAWVNSHPPKYMSHKRNCVTSHNLPDREVYHFTKKGANTYLKETLACHNLTLGNNKLTQRLTTLFGAHMREAFGISFTSWSYPDGDLYPDDIDRNTSLRLIDGCLDVCRDFSGVSDGDFCERHGYGLFLQVVSSST